MSGWAFDFRQTLRRLSRQAAFTVTATGTLGVAVAACALVLAFGWAAVVQPVALFPDPDRLVDLQSTRNRGPDDRFGVSPADFLAWRDAQTAFDAFGAYVPIGEVDLVGDGEAGREPWRLRSHVASAGVFRALAVAPALGRTFVAAEEVAGADRVTVLSDHLWRRLGAAPDVVGATLILAGVGHRVVGVMPPGFGLRGGVPDMWTPLAFGPDRPPDRRTGTLVVVGRLRPGIGIERARAELDAIGAALEAEHPDTNRDLRPSLRPLVPLLTAQVRPLALLLLGAVLAVLAVATVNLGNLLLASAIARQGEMAVRSSLGARPGRLARLVLLEGVCLAVLAALAGTLVAAGALRVLPDLRGKFLFQSVELRLAPAVLALTVLLAVGAAMLAAVVPAVRAARASTRTVRRAATNATQDRRSARLGNALVVGQIAATLALLAVAGLLVRSLVERLGTDLGYTAEGLLSLDVAPSPARYPAAEDLVRLTDRLREELAAVPGVEGVAASDDLPGAGWPVSVWAGGAQGAADEPVRLTLHLVTPGYFDALGVRLLTGQPPGPLDGPGAPRVAVLSQTAARQLFGEDSPLGRSVAVDDPSASHRVVGIVPDLRRDPSRQAGPAVYLAYAQHATMLDVVGQRRRLFILRTAVAPESLTRAATAAVHRVDPLLPVTVAQPLAARVADLSFRPRLATELLVGFALLALGLSAVGLYALSTATVARRRREIGVRIALGAGRPELVRLFGLPAAGMVAAGIALGVVFAIVLGRAMSSLLFGVSPYDPSALAAAAGLLALTMAAAVVAPIRRSLRVEPREALAE